MAFVSDSYKIRVAVDVLITFLHFFFFFFYLDNPEFDYRILSMTQPDTIKIDSLTIQSASYITHNDLIFFILPSFFVRSPNL